MRKYESLARKREHDVERAAEKVEKKTAKDNSGKVDKNGPTLDPPHLQTSFQIRASRDQTLETKARSPYGYPFLVPVPMYLPWGEGCVPESGSLIDSSGACGIGGFNGGGACGGGGCGERGS